MTFHIGQKVVCIKEGPWKVYTVDGVPPEKHPNLPQKGKVYTIADIDPYKGKLFLAFEEIGTWKDAESFLSDWFRPVKVTDISIFKSLLVKPPKAKVDA